MTKNITHNVVLNKVKLEEIIKEFNWTYQGKSILGCRVKLLGTLYLEEFKECRETSIFVTVFNEKVTKLFKNSIGKDIFFNCEGYLTYKKVNSNKFVNKFDQSPAVYGVLDIVVRVARVAGPVKNVEEQPTSTTFNTLEDIFDE